MQKFRIFYALQTKVSLNKTQNIILAYRVSKFFQSERHQWQDEEVMNPLPKIGQGQNICVHCHAPAQSSQQDISHEVGHTLVNIPL